MPAAAGRRLRRGAQPAGRQRLRRARRDASREQPSGRPRVVIAAWSPTARATGWRSCCPTTARRHRRGRTLGRRCRRCAAERSALAVLPLERGFESRRSGGHRRAGHPRRPPGRGRERKRRARRTSWPRLGADAGRSRRPHRPRHRPLRRAEDARGRRRAARLPAAHLRRRRQALPAGREHRAARPATAPTDEASSLDRLGGAAWQARKARLKERLREMAGELIRIAAERAAAARRQPMAPPDGLFDEFCARFPYEETDDQLHARSPTCWRTWPPAGRWTG